MLEGESKGHLPTNAPWSVCLGPGPLLDELGPVLLHLGRSVNGQQGFQVNEVGDVAELLRPDVGTGGAGGAGRLVLAGDGFPEEDIGFVRRFLAANPGWELVVLGRDAGTRVARALLALDRVRWLNLPPDLDQLRELARAPRSDEPAPAEPPPRAESPPALGDYLGPLSDMVQRVDLSLGLARASASPESLESPAEEVGDLRQMTRMLKRVAAPPPVGGEVFDAGELFEERLATAAIQSPRELRFLPRGERGHRVQADRGALAEALSSLLALARGCAAPDGVVRAPYEALADGSVRLALEFPEGPLAGADLRELLRPRRRRRPRSGARRGGPACGPGRGPEPGRRAAPRARARRPPARRAAPPPGPVDGASGGSLGDRERRLARHSAVQARGGACRKRSTPVSPAPNTHPVTARVLMVLSDPWEAQALEAALVEAGCEVERADAPGSVTALGRSPWTAVLADADASGMELVRLAQELEGGPPVILLAGFGTIADAVEAMRRGAFDYVARPVPPERLLVHLARAGEHRALQRENRELRATLERTYRLGHLQTRDERMRRVLALIETVADTRATVLLSGESGTGKTLLARTIHARSARAARPCVVLDCGALPPTLLESELFGHARGAFTGALRDKPGLVETADGGTLFLDEVASASLDLQAKLLRVLQERVFERVGETRTRAVDVRLIAATNRDLAGRGRRRPLPPGPLLPHQRRAPGPAAAARAAGRRPAARRGLPRALRPRARPSRGALQPRSAGGPDPRPLARQRARARERRRAGRAPGPGWRDPRRGSRKGGARGGTAPGLPGYAAGSAARPAQGGVGRSRAGADQPRPGRHRRESHAGGGAARDQPHDPLQQDAQVRPARHADRARAGPPMSSRKQGGRFFAWFFFLLVLGLVGFLAIKIRRGTEGDPELLMAEARRLSSGAEPDIPAAIDKLNFALRIAQEEPVANHVQIGTVLAARGGLFGEIGQYAQARIDLERVLEDYRPGDLDVQIDLASVLLETEELRAALELTEAVLAADPRRADAWTLQSRALVALADEIRGEALEICEDALPDQKEAQAQEALDRITSLELDSPQRVSWLYKLRSLFEFREDARLRDVLRLSEQASDYVAEARTALAESFRERPSQAALLDFQGLLRRAGRRDLAIAFGLAAINYREANANIAFVRALLEDLLAEDRPHTGVDVINQYFARDVLPDANFYRVWCETLYRDQRWSSLVFVAQSSLNAATSDQEQAEANLYLGLAHANQQQFFEAPGPLSKFTASSAYDPFPGARLTANLALATCHRELRQDAPEKSALRGALKDMPDDHPEAGASWLRLAELIRITEPGSGKEAFEALTHGVRLAPERVEELYPVWRSQGEQRLVQTRANLNLIYQALVAGGQLVPEGQVEPYELVRLAELYAADRRSSGVAGCCRKFLLRYPGFLPVLEMYIATAREVDDADLLARLLIERVKTAGVDRATLDELAALPPNLLTLETRTELMRLDPEHTGRLALVRDLQARGGPSTPCPGSACCPRRSSTRKATCSRPSWPSSSSAGAWPRKRSRASPRARRSTGGRSSSSSTWRSPPRRATRSTA